jgi:hypothetical protein
MSAVSARAWRENVARLRHLRTVSWNSRGFELSLSSSLVPWPGFAPQPTDRIPFEPLEAPLL